MTIGAYTEAELADILAHVAKADEPGYVGGVPTDHIRRLLATIAARDEQLVLANGAFDNLEMTCEALRLSLAQNDEEIARLLQLRQHGCECSDDEACMFARERDEARAEIARLRKPASLEMRTRNEVNETLSSLLARPEMWAASAEAFEAQFSMLLWMLRLERPHLLIMSWWCKKKPGRQGNIPLWSQMQTLNETVESLRQFYDEEIRETLA